MNPKQLLDYIIRPAIDYMGVAYNKPAAEILLLATSAQETHCGQFVHQIDGPALGIYQCEPTTHALVQIWAERHAPEIVISHQSSHERLVYDLRYATIIARLLYRSIPEPLPAIDRDAMFQYYKTWYNRTGKATHEEWNTNWAKYVAPVLEAVK